MTPAYCDDDLAVGADGVHAGLIAGLELVDQREVHAADEADASSILPTSAASAPTRNEPSSSRNLSAARFGGGGIMLPGDVDWRARSRRRRNCTFGYSFASCVEVVGEDEADADDEVHAFGGQQPQARLAIGALAGLDEADARAELSLARSAPR